MSLYTRMFSSQQSAFVKLEKQSAEYLKTFISTYIANTF